MTEPQASANRDRAVAAALDLLPALYLLRDARFDGSPGLTEGLVTLIAEQFALVDDDLDQLYDDLFIETCSPQMIPYLGDLVAVLPGAPVDTDAVLTRAAVADAIALRRRKGTVAVLEQLAFAITGWPAAAVEMFQQTATTQHLHNVAPHRGATVSFRSALALERLHGPFDRSSHTAELRRIGSHRGTFGVQNVAVYVWRDAVRPHTWVDASALDQHRFRFSPLGFDRALVTRRRTERLIASHAAPENVPGTLTRRALAATPELYYGDGLSVLVQRSGELDPVPLADIVVCDLSDTAGGGWSNASRLTPAQVGVDPELGRLAFGSPQLEAPLVVFDYADPSDLGGGENVPRRPHPDGIDVAVVRRDGAGGAAKSPSAAVAAGAGIVEIGDSRTYLDDPSTSLPADGRLRIASAPGTTPLLRLGSPWIVTVGEGGVLEIANLTIAGAPVVVRGRPTRVIISDTTLVPGQRVDAASGPRAPVGPSLVLDVDEDWQTEVIIERCITGPLFVPPDGSRLHISDSVVDGVGDGLGVSLATVATGRVIPAIRSVAPIPALPLGLGSTGFLLGVGDEPPVAVNLAQAPTDAATAGPLLAAALAATPVRVLIADDRVLLLGDGRPLWVADETANGLAAALGLLGAQAGVRAVLSAPVDVVAASAGGRMHVDDEMGAAAGLDIAPGAADLVSFATNLRSALRLLAGFADATVETLGASVVVVAARPTTFSAAPDDPMAWSTGLITPRPTIAAEASGAPAAALTLERCTVFGSVQVVAVDRVNDSIVTGPMTAERRQVGCVQYSWLAAGSSTPRRHECQPDSPETPPLQFLSTGYGTPRYGRLRRAGASAVIRGASDGFEMGALAHLRQTQRDDNLRRGLAEFLRFGLEAGVLDGQ